MTKAVLDAQAENSLTLLGVILATRRTMSAGSGGGDSPRYFRDRRSGSDLSGSSTNSAVPRISAEWYGFLRSNTDTDTRGSRAKFRAFCLSAVSEITTVLPSADLPEETLALLLAVARASDRGIRGHRFDLPVPCSLTERYGSR
jgi:hypothetical protein